MTGTTQEHPAHIQVEVWTDLVCPWCYLGNHRLRGAIATVGTPTTVVPRSFLLDPSAGAGRSPMIDHLAAKVGGRTRARALEEQMQRRAAAEGLPYAVGRPYSSTRPVHRAVELANAHHVGDLVFDTLQRGYFAGELDPFDPSTLVEVSVEAGVPHQEARSALADPAHHDTELDAAVEADITRARALGITGVPFTLVDGAVALPGAHDTDGYVRALTPRQESSRGQDLAR